MAYIIGCAVAAAVGYYLGGKAELSDMLDLLARFSEDNDSIRHFLDIYDKDFDGRI